MKTIITTFIFSIITLISSAQLKTGDKVFLQYQEVKDKKNVNGDDACQMLQSYILGKTSLIIVNNIDNSANNEDNNNKLQCLSPKSFPFLK